jgi:hypothetical protein
MKNFINSLPEPPLGAEARSFVYLVSAGLTASVYLGTSNMQTSAVIDRTSSVLYALAAGACLAAAVQRSNATIWAISGSFVVAANLLRSVALALYGTASVMPRPATSVDIAFVVMGVYLFAAFAAAGCWLAWLRPIAVDGEGRVRWKE